MLLSREKAIEAFTKVKLVKEEYMQYSLAPNANRISIEDLRAVVERMYNIKVIVSEVSFDAEHTRGLIERWDGHAKIRVRQNLSQHFKRLTATKELCHIVIDEEEDWSPSGATTIQNLVIEYNLERDEEADRISQSEALAELAAMELLYPFDVREIDLKKLESEETTIAKIAGEHNVPEMVVQRTLNKRYHAQIATPLWAGILS